ncbi:hypothetical protein MYX82_08380 [Acidobacteria bacterium AH-259-D05]|nr:hypothetical protein [Acidobacteria bacterium AH-259-D05]
MKHRRAIFEKNIIVLLLCFCFILHAEGKGEDRQVTNFKSASVEKRLRQYLGNRILIFRQQGIEGNRIISESSGRLLQESRQQDNSGRRAILFVDLELHPERLVIFGEEIQIRIKNGKRTYVRDSRKLNLLTWMVMLDDSAEEITFPKLIGILSQIFLEKDELPEVYSTSSSDDHAARRYCQVKPLSATIGR